MSRYVLHRRKISGESSSKVPKLESSLDFLNGSGVTALLARIFSSQYSDGLFNGAEQTTTAITTRWKPRAI